MRHLKALLVNSGAPAKDLKKNRADLLAMYWSVHQDIGFEVEIYMKVGRYFGTDLYNGKVVEVGESVHTIEYEDGDKEEMDEEQVQYANALYVQENR